MLLSQQQKDAVEYNGSPALVVAGAGSGKTRILTAKVEQLISEGYNPERILAITFTNKAAGEMKKRLVSLTGVPQNKFPWVRTFHSACFQILKKHCTCLGYQPHIQIYSTYHQQKTLKDILEKFNFDKKHLSVVLYQISNAKNSGDPKGYIDKNPKFYSVRLIDVYEEYERSLKIKNAIDFDNILLLTRNLIRDNEDVRKYYQELFQFILVDEYQDTNNLQEDLMQLLIRGGNLFCVGDDWQAIYGFRGSNVNHFLSFIENYKDSKIFKLEENYRSYNEIVQVANKLIRFNECRVDKHCFSEKNGGVIEIHRFEDDIEEAKWIAKKAKMIQEHGIGFEKMAILYRTKFCSLAFEKVFRSLGIPYQLLDSKGFFERREVLDINCYLISSIFPKDDTAFERILNAPKRGIGPAMLKKIADIKTGGMSMQDAVRKSLTQINMSPKIHQALNQLMQLLDIIKDKRPDEAIREILKQVNYLDYLKQFATDPSDMTSREENIMQLIYSASLMDTIEDYLEEAALVREDKEDEKNEKKKGINLSTIHGSKGLEYGVVFVVGCEENLFPHWKSMDSERELEEERRLMYVAITRAERYVFLSSAGFRKGEFNRRSRFLEEIEANLGKTKAKKKVIRN